MHITFRCDEILFIFHIDFPSVNRACVNVLYYYCSERFILHPATFSLSIYFPSRWNFFLSNPLYTILRESTNKGRKKSRSISEYKYFFTSWLITVDTVKILTGLTARTDLLISGFATSRCLIDFTCYFV